MHAATRMSYLPDDMHRMYVLLQEVRGGKDKNRKKTKGGGSTTVGAAGRCGFLMGWSGVRYIYIYVIRGGCESYETIEGV